MSAQLDMLLTGEQLAACVAADLMSQAVIARATVYRSRSGSRKAFPTLEEARAFDRGYDSFLWGQHMPAERAEALGWLEAERACDDARDMRDDERRERAERA